MHWFNFFTSFVSPMINKVNKQSVVAILIVAFLGKPIFCLLNFLRLLQAFVHPALHHVLANSQFVQLPASAANIVVLEESAAQEVMMA